jgi:hypothetical protein
MARQKHHGGRAWWRKAADLMTARKPKEREERAWGQGISFKYSPPVAYFVQLGPTSK